MADHQACLHVDEPDRVGHALANAANLLRDIGPDRVAVEVVVNGDAVKSFRRGSQHRERIQELDDMGVVFVACENSLDSRGLAADDLLAAVGTVPSGVGELTRKQSRGWAYIRP